MTPATNNYQELSENSLRSTALPLNESPHSIASERLLSIRTPTPFCQPSSTAKLQTPFPKFPQTQDLKLKLGSINYTALK